MALPPIIPMSPSTRIPDLLAPDISPREGHLPVAGSPAIRSDLHFSTPSSPIGHALPSAAPPLREAAARHTRKRSRTGGPRPVRPGILMRALPPRPRQGQAAGGARTGPGGLKDANS